MNSAAASWSTSAPAQARRRNLRWLFSEPVDSWALWSHPSRWEAARHELESATPVLTVPLELSCLGLDAGPTKSQLKPWGKLAKPVSSSGLKKATAGSWGALWLKHALEQQLGSAAALQGLRLHCRPLKIGARVLIEVDWPKLAHANYDPLSQTIAADTGDSLSLLRVFQPEELRLLLELAGLRLKAREVLTSQAGRGLILKAIYLGEPGVRAS